MTRENRYILPATLPPLKPTHSPPGKMSPAPTRGFFLGGEGGGGRQSTTATSTLVNTHQPILSCRYYTTAWCCLAIATYVDRTNQMLKRGHIMGAHHVTVQ